MNYDAPETIPISYLNALEYCPRRYFYEFVEGDMIVNDFVLAGSLLHERADEAGKHTTEDGAYQINHLYLYSEKLRQNSAQPECGIETTSSRWCQSASSRSGQNSAQHGLPACLEKACSFPLLKAIMHR